MWGIEPNTLALLVLAVMQGFNLYYAHKTEKNTNSMKDALVARTAESAHAAGRDEMRAEGEAKAASVAQGVRQGEAASNNGFVGERPLPVTDNRVAVAAEKSAEASVRIADVAERTADKQDESTSAGR